MPGIVLAINIPRAAEEEIAGVSVAKMGGIHLRFAYEEIGGESDDGSGTRLFRPRIGRETDFPDESDTAAFMRDRITITPLEFDWTAHSVLDQLRGWNLSQLVTASGGASD